MSSRRLEDVCELVMGQAPDGESYNAEGVGLPLIAGAGDFGDVYPRPTKFTTRPARTSQAGDIILGIRATIGRKVVADGDYCLGRGVAGLRPKSGLDARYLWHWLTHVEPALASKGRGATFKQVNRDDIAGLAIGVPPIGEQRRIADLLDRADLVRTKRGEALGQLGNLPQATFHEMFGGSESILLNWPRATMGELLDFLTSGSRGWAAYYADAGDLFLRIQNVRRDELSLDDVAFVHAPATAEARRTEVRPGDVLMSITADLGRTAVVPPWIGRAFINQHLSILRTKTATPRFLSAYLASPAGQRQVLRRDRHGVKAGLNFDDIRAIEVPMPPPRAQREFADRAEAIDSYRSRLLKSAVEIDNFSASLRDRAFAGKP